MSINLLKPLQTDVYDISVFNQNSTIIEDAVNQNISDINDINNALPDKYNITFVTNSAFTIDTLLADGIYYLKVTPAGTLPSNVSGTGIFISNSYSDGTTTQTLITNETGTDNYQLFIRKVNSSSSITAWQSLTSSVIDNLNSSSTTSSLSANQGKILNESKLSIEFLGSSDSINIDAAEFGIYICDGATVSAISGDTGSIDFSTSSNNHFILEVYGDSNHSTYQKIYDCFTEQAIQRYKTLGSSSWSIWYKNEVNIPNNSIGNTQIANYVTIQSNPAWMIQYDVTDWHLIGLSFTINNKQYSFSAPVKDGRVCFGGIIDSGTGEESQNVILTYISYVPGEITTVGDKQYLILYHSDNYIFNLDVTNIPYHATFSDNNSVFSLNELFGII